MSVDSWMNKQLNDHLSQQDNPTGSFSFRHNLRGGWVNVHVSVDWEDSSDEDGVSTDLVAKISYCHWCFSEDCEVDLTKYEKREITDAALELAQDI